MKKTQLIFAILLCAFLQVKSQHYLTLSNSNYGGIFSSNINPASLVNSNINMGICLGNFNITANNSSRKFSFNELKNADSTFNWNNANGEQLNFLLPQVNVQGPSFFISKRKWGAALGSRVRLYNQVSSFSTDFLPYLTGKNPNWNNTIPIKDADGFNINMHVFSDIQGSFGYNVLKMGKHELSVGASVKYVSGLFNFYLNGNKLDAVVDQTNESLTVNNIDLSMGSNIDVSVGSQLDNLTSVDGAFSFLKSNDFTGKGVGFDLGATYTYMGSDLKNYLSGQNVGTYLFKVSASMVDIGQIAYKKGRNFELKGSGVLSDTTLDGIDSLSVESIENTFRNLGFTVNSKPVGTKSISKLPTTLYIQADVHLLKNVYVNATLITNVANKLSVGNYNYNEFVLTPRFESKLFEASVPFTFNSVSKDVKFGTALRFGPVFLGSNDLSLFMSNSKGVNFYVGAQMGFYKKQNKKKKEKNND